MKSRIFFALMFLGALAAGAPVTSAADLSQATVRQKVNVVTLAPHLNAAPHPVSQGAVVRDDNVVRTGNESRAELQFTDLTLARLGANAIFSFDAQARTIECERGALLFSKPTNSGRVDIRAAAVTAAITGSTGFVDTSVGGPHKKGAVASAEEATTIVGMLEGKLHGASNWRDRGGQVHTFHFSLGAGEMLVAQPGRPPVVAQFDIPRFLKTSPLVKGFKGDLLNQADLQKAVAAYEADQRRGFIDRVGVP
ncbi:MAG TPA: FecR domain-containing protein, partial [Chthoniobacterales bacterium]